MKLMVIHGQYPPEELEPRRRLVLQAASPGTEIEYSEIVGDIFKLSHNADDELLCMLAGPQVVEKAREAQNLGFDAVIFYGTLDIGVDAARSQVDIPVVGMGRSGFCIAANLATRISVIVYQSTMIPNAWKFIREIGLKDFVTSVRAVDIAVKDLAAEEKAFKEALIKLGRIAVKEEDAEIIVPRGISMVPYHFSAEEISSEVGVPVMDCVVAGIKTAEMLVNMGMKNSRKAYPRH